MPGENLSGDIWVMGADGSSPHAADRAAGDERYPSFSPDGRALAFTTHAGAADDTEVAVARADGGAPAAITDNAVFDSAPVLVPGRRPASRSSAGRRATIPETTSGR